MKTSFAHLCITCRNEEVKERVKALLAGVTPFEEVEEQLIYMELASEDAMEIPAMLEDLALLLEEHKEALSSAGNLRDCTLELIAHSPLSCSSRACPTGVLEFAREIGATVVMNGEKAVDFDRAFENVIGYTGVKEELYQILDMMINSDKYKRIGARIPRGVLLYGRPGIGKSMMASAFMRACGRKCYVLRRNQPDGDFVREMKCIFDAAQREPSVILLDDLDKFAVEEKRREEFVAVQSCIDEARDADVLVIATANDIRNIPDSLLRAGRFDRHIQMHFPKGKDAERIVQHYLKKKAVAGVNCEDIAKMLCGRSCAALESVLNAAAIQAAYRGKSQVDMEEIVSATLSGTYGISQDVDGDEYSTEEQERIAYHEAGHAVMAEVIKEGSVGLVSVNAHNQQARGDKGGFMLPCKDFDRRPHYILISLGGKAAVEMQYGSVASGTGSDLHDAMRHIDVSIANVGTLGMGLLDVSGKPTDFSKFFQECASHAEIERYLFKAKEILAQNRDFLHAVARELLEKKVLLHSDMKRIRAGVQITPATIG